jgi:hypothetical protein
MFTEKEHENRRLWDHNMNGKRSKNNEKNINKKKTL